MIWALSTGRRSVARENARDPIGDSSHRFVFPSPKHSPASPFESLADRAVSCDIAGQLWAPVVGIRTWFVAVHWTDVPETAVDEHRQPRTREHHIRPDHPVWKAHGKILSKPQAPAMKLRTHRHFRRRVATRVSAHPLANGIARRVGIRERHAARGYIARSTEQEFAATSRKLLP